MTMSYINQYIETEIFDDEENSISETHSSSAVCRVSERKKSSGDNSAQITCNEIEERPVNMSESENSWDTVSSSSSVTDCCDENNQNNTVNPTTTEEFAQALPLICDIAHQVYCASQGRVELMVFDVNDKKNVWNATNIWKEKQQISCQNLNVLNICSTEKCQENESTTDFCTQTSVSQEEIYLESGDISKLTATSTDDRDISDLENCISNDSKNNIEVSEYSKKDLVLSKERHNIGKSKSIATLPPHALIMNKGCHTTVSCSQVRNKQFVGHDMVFKSVNDFLQFSDTEKESIGDYLTCNKEFENCAQIPYIKNIHAFLKPYIHIEQPLKYPCNDNIFGEQTFECHLVSVDRIESYNEDNSNVSLNDVQNNIIDNLNQVVITSEQNLELPVVQNTAAPASGEDENPLDFQEESDSTRIRRRSIRQVPTLLSSRNLSRNENPQAWVLLDSEGHTQEASFSSESENFPKL